MRNICSIPSTPPEGWKTKLASCAALGFDSVCCRLQGGDLFATGCSDSLPIDQFCALATAAGLAVMVDVRVDALHPLAPDIGLARRADRPRYLDPRVSPNGSGPNLVDFGDWDSSSDALSRRWVALVCVRLRQLADAGVAAFRCLEAERTPPAVWRTIFEALKAGADNRQPCFAAQLSPASDGNNPGFDMAIIPVAPFDWRRFAAVSNRFGAVLAEPRAPFTGDDAVALEDQWALCAALADGLFDSSAALARSARPAVDLADRTSMKLSAAISYAKNRKADFGASAFGGRHLDGAGIHVIARRSHPAADGGAASRLALINSAASERSCDLAHLSSLVGEYLPMRDAFGRDPQPFGLQSLVLAGGEVRVLEGIRSDFIAQAASEPDALQRATRDPRIAIETVTPSVDGGRFPAKRIVGELVAVEADVFGEGHDPIAVALQWRAADEREWREAPMAALGNDRWRGDLPLERVGRYYFNILGWRDEFAIYCDHLRKKDAAGVARPVDVAEGRLFITETLATMSPALAQGPLTALRDRLAQADDSAAIKILLDEETASVVNAAGVRAHPTRLHQDIPLESERNRAAFASWYQLFPRSLSGDATRHGIFDDVAQRLPAIQSMGFDVVYFPPIHPIGHTNRKGRNNSLVAEAGDPGSPYAIGSQEGGHDAIHPQLGGFDDFDRLVEAARRLDMEIALDLAIQTSPDHPWIREHPEWFDWRPDGSIRFAENPPKRYEDIVNVDFYAPGATPSLWLAIYEVVRVWIGHGVKLFRVDNPHTKPLPFWEWLIAEIRREHPDVVFLSEAFTRPKVMYRLAKVGFSQSYTYFTWRNTKWELTSYLEELSEAPPSEFFRPHFFVNTHDINPDFLQNAPRSAFLIRAALATTLSGLWGMYSGFELCEGRPDKTRKEYSDSEKYQLVAWDWNRPGNIVAEIAALNAARRANPALQSHLGIQFHVARNDNILYFEKATPSRDNVVLVAVSLDPHNVQEAEIELPLWNFDLPDDAALAVEDLVRGHKFTWRGKFQRIRLDPSELPYSLWRLSRVV
jgi:starch synthase (maltosyl-transferring)